MWLVGRLAPDFKTVADFGKHNGEAIRAVCRQFVELCRRLNLSTRAVVAIDGSKFKAVNNRDKNFTVAKVGKRREQVDAAIELAAQHATFLFCKYCAWIALLEAKFDTVANYRILACTSIVLDFADDTPGKFRSLVSIFPKAPIAAAKPAR